jgi:2'-5' RNA ligase
MSAAAAPAGGPRPNWFVGLPVDGRFLASHVTPPPRGFRAFHPDDLHLTVAFLGPCGDEAALRALAALDEALASDPSLRAPIETSLGEVVPMGDPRRYSALSALLVAGRAETEARMAALRDPLADAAGSRREVRPPKAHVTLARPSRTASPADRRAGLAWAGALALEDVHVRLDRVALYTWSLDRGSRLFRIVAARALDHAGARSEPS